MPGANQEHDLFSTLRSTPEGFYYQRNFISEAEECELVERIQKLQLTPFKFHQFTGKRRTATFGWDYAFGAADITEAAALPEFLLPLRSRAGSLFKIRSDGLVQATIIEYLPERPSAGMGYSAVSRGHRHFSRHAMSTKISPISPSALEASVVMKRYRWTYNRVGLFAERRCARKLAAFDTSGERAALLDRDADPAGKTGVILLGLNPANAILLKSWNRRGYRVSINALRCSVVADR